MKESLEYDLLSTFLDQPISLLLLLRLASWVGRVVYRLEESSRLGLGPCRLKQRGLTKGNLHSTRRQQSSRGGQCGRRKATPLWLILPSSIFWLTLLMISGTSYQMDRTIALLLIQYVQWILWRSVFDLVKLSSCPFSDQSCWTYVYRSGIRFYRWTQLLCSEGSSSTRRQYWCHLCARWAAYSLDVFHLPCSSGGTLDQCCLPLMFDVCCSETRACRSSYSGLLCPTVEPSCRFRLKQAHVKSRVWRPHLRRCLCGRLVSRKAWDSSWQFLLGPSSLLFLSLVSAAAYHACSSCLAWRLVSGPNQWSWAERWAR